MILHKLALLLLLAGASLHVRLQDSLGRPVASVPVTLVVYELRGTTAYEISVGSCTTDPAGECEIPVPEHVPRDAAGLIRGALVVGNYGRRSVLWPGGTATWVINVDHIAEGREAQPLPGDERGLGLQVRPGWQRFLPWIWLLLAGGAAIGWFFARRKR